MSPFGWSGLCQERWTVSLSDTAESCSTLYGSVENHKTNNMTIIMSTGKQHITRNKYKKMTLLYIIVVSLHQDFTVRLTSRKHAYIMQTPSPRQF